MHTPHHGPARQSLPSKPTACPPSRGCQLLWLSVLIMLARRQARVAAQQRTLDLLMP